MTGNPSVMPEWLRTTLDREREERLAQVEAETSERAIRARQSLEQVQFEHAFESLMDVVAGGATLANAVKDYPIAIDRVRFNAWVQRNPERKAAYELAKVYRTDVLSDRMLAVAAGEIMQGGLPREVARDQLEVNTLKWVMGADNRKVYGDVKQLDVTGGISITAVFADIAQRTQAIPSLLSTAIEETAEYTDFPLLTASQSDRVRQTDEGDDE